MTRVRILPVFQTSLSRCTRWFQLLQAVPSISRIRRPLPFVVWGSAR